MNASNMSMDSLNQKADFWDLLKDALPAMQVFNPREAAGGWWLAMKCFTFEQAQTAITRLLQLGKRAPVPADAVAILLEDYEAAWLSAEEAWAVVGIMADENRSTFTTTAIDQALQSTGLNELIADDKIAGRMAFKAAYERVKKQWMAEGRTPQTRFAAGLDRVEREEVVKAALTHGAITHEQAAAYLPAPKAAATDLVRIAQDNAGKIPEAQEAMSELRKMFGLGEFAVKPKWNVADRIFVQDGITMVEIDGVVKRLDELEDRANV